MQVKLVRAFEELLSHVAPSFALRREEAKARLDAFSKLGKRGYEGASRGRRTKGWHAPDTSAITESRGALATLRARSRDLVRNNGYVKKGVGAIASNTIGTGIVPQARGTASKRRLAQIQTEWKRWAGTTACDFEGLHTFYGIQRLAMRTLAESGEVLIRKRYARSGGKVSLTLQVLEADFVDTTKEQALSEGGSIVQGVEFDASGRRVAYWLFSHHPGGAGFATFGTLTSVRVPADEVIHLYRVDRPGQVRGIPWTAALLINLRDLDEYEDAELVRRKIAACFTGFVTDVTGESTGKSPSISEKFEPGSIEILPPGQDIKLATPPSVTGYSEYVVQMLRKIAAALEVPYETLTGDYSQVNFSSGRMGWLEFQRVIEDWRWNLFVPRVCDRSWAWFLEALEISTGIRTDDVTVEWTAPAREMIDPVKEVNALVTKVRAGFMSLPEAIRESGYDPEAVLEEIAECAKKLDGWKLVLDSDPRKTGSNGRVQDNAGEGVGNETPAAS